jgi:hypothetical protein
LLIIIVVEVVNKYSSTSRFKESFVNKQFNIVTNKS